MADLDKATQLYTAFQDLCVFMLKSKLSQPIEIIIDTNDFDELIKIKSETPDLNTYVYHGLQGPIIIRRQNGKS